MHDDSTSTNDPGSRAEDRTGGAGFDRDEFLEQLGGDLEIARELVALFLEAWPEMVGRVRRTVDAGSPPDLYSTAHELKGMVGNFSQGPAMQAAGMLEALGRSGSMAGSAELLVDLDARLRGLDAALRRFLTDPAPRS